MPLTDNARGALLMVGSMTAFTLNDACMKALGAEMPLFQALFLRGALTTLLLYLVARAWGGFARGLSRRDAGLLALRTACEVAAAWLFLTALFNQLIDQAMTEIYTGIRGFRRGVLDPDGYRRMGFDHILELTAVTARRGGRIAEVPAGYHPRTRGVSEMNHLREFTKFLYWVVHHRLTR